MLLFHYYLNLNQIYQLKNYFYYYYYKLNFSKIILIKKSNRKIYKIVSDGRGKLGVIGDSLGRVILIDAQTYPPLFLRMWKGYRDPQLAFLNVVIPRSSKSQRQSGPFFIFYFTIIIIIIIIIVNNNSNNELQVKVIIIIIIINNYYYNYFYL